MAVQPAHNPFLGKVGIRPSAVPATNQSAIAANPLFGRPTWTYATTNQSSRYGPLPRLSLGSGRTGAAAASGQQAMVPGYVSAASYLPNPPLDNQPVYSGTFQGQIPRTINTGDNGRELVGTYQPHDFTPGQRFLTVIRSAHNWQNPSFPANFRSLNAWQQVSRYRLQTLTQSSRALDSSNYFLGYQTNPNTAASIGGFNALGYMGSR